jgi:hypothetical protein
VFCECGSDGHAQVDDRPRPMPVVRDHARNAARTLSLLGYDSDPGVLVQEVERLKRQDGELLDNILAVACDRAFKSD